jgi:ABC-type transporter Mla maintaining outer membrane lipid asymmetry ATPase subunit MlaF
VQERTLASDMPAAVTAFCAKKGELYTMLKIINNVGHELYAHNQAEAAKFNMSILHRRAPQAATPEPDPPAPAPAT